MTTLIYGAVKISVGLLYPAYSSFKAVHTKNVKEYVKWMMYWIVFAFFLLAETLTDLVLYWIPFYVEIKLVFLLWLMAPLTRGSSLLYRKFVHPQLVRHERDIDGYMDQVREQGYQALIALSARGFNFATNIVLSTAIKGSDSLRRSWSLSDLSSTSHNDSSSRSRYKRFAQRTHSLRSQSSFSAEDDDDEEEERYRQDLEGSQMVVRRRDLHAIQTASGDDMLIRRRELATDQPVAEDMLMRRRDLAGDRHLEELDRELRANQSLLKQRLTANKELLAPPRKHRQTKLNSFYANKNHISTERINEKEGADVDVYLTGSRSDKVSRISDHDSATLSQHTPENPRAVKSQTAADLKANWLGRDSNVTASTTAATAVISASVKTSTAATKMTIYKKF